MIIIGLLGEAVAIIWIPSGPTEKTVSVVCTLGIALGVWLEWVGGDAIEAKEKEESELRLSELNAKAAEANERAAHADERRVKLEARLSPRSSLLNQSALANGLPRLPKQYVSLVASPSTPESEMFVRHLAAPLTEVGWDVEILPGTATATILFPTGVVIQWQFDPALANNFDIERDTPPAPVKLAELLNGMGIEASVVPGMLSQPYTLGVVASTK